MVRNVTDDDVGLKVLYEPGSNIQDTGPVPSVDLVAIHGIGAHPDDTWCKKVNTGGSEEQYVNWLRDAHMLPKVIPQTRIMRYGYESQWFGGEAISLKASTVAQRLLRNLNRVRTEDRLRPLIFIAHCFGGLVVLKAIVDAKRSDNKWPGIYKSTVGMLFFGTPFRGAGGLNQAQIIQAIQSQYDCDQVQESNLKILEPGNETLMDLMDLFFETRQESNMAHIACFFEQKPSNVGAIYRGARIQKFVVDEASGCLDQSEATEKFSLSRDHFNMNKFGKPEEEDFETVCDVIEAMVKQAPSLVAARDQVRDNYRVEFRLTSLPVTGHFIDRESEMREIEESLHGNANTGRRIHILHGLGGIGKTQLAIAYTRKHQEMYSAIVWLNGNSKDTLFQGLAAFGRHANINSLPDVPITTMQHADDINAEAEAVLRWLAIRKNRQWLMIVDNIDREYSTNTEDLQSFNILSFLPPADHGCILITTRLLSLREFGQSTKTPRMNMEQALELLSDRSGLSRITIGMEELVKRLGHLPLALVQAGRYMLETGTNCLKYLELYTSSWSRLVAEVPQLRDYTNGSIHTTWMISYERVTHENPTAAKLLQLWSYLDHQDIWYELIHRGSRGCPECLWLQELATDEISFKIIVKTLLAYSLVESRQGAESYSMHPVVHDWCTEKISCGRADLIACAFLIVGFNVPATSEQGYWLSQRRLLPHAERCFQQFYKLDYSNRMKDSLFKCTFYTLGGLFMDQSKLIEAESMYQRALNGYEKIFGPEHASTLDIVNDLGLLYRHQGKLKEAESMYQRALDGREKLLGREHTSTNDIVSNLGTLYIDQGKLAEAEPMYRRALAGYEKAWGPEYKSTHNTVSNLGALYTIQGKRIEAERMCQRALNGYEKSLGREHKSILDAVNILGILYKDQGKFAEAEPMFQRAVDGYEKALGREHKSTLNAVNNLGTLYLDQGKLTEAEPMFQRALDGYEKALGLEHWSIFEVIDNLGILYGKQGKLGEAEKIFQRALDGIEKALGLKHTSTLNTVSNLGTLYKMQGKLEKAESMYQRALDGYQKVLGPEHTSILDTFNYLGNIYKDQGKLTEAEKMYQRARDGHQVDGSQSDD